MYEKTIKFKLEKKFFNEFGYLDNKYIYDWMNLAKKYFFKGAGINIDMLADLNLYYADIDVKFSTKYNIRYTDDSMYIKTWIEKHNGVKTIFAYEMYIDGRVIIAATSSHNILGMDSDRPIRIDRTLPKWDQILKDLVAVEENK